MKLLVLKGMSLNTMVYRGFAPIKDISAISASDILNQDTNPQGLQRDLSDKHSRDGYRYAEGGQQVPDHTRLWPEVILNVRDESAISLMPVDETHNLWEVEVDEKKIDKTRLLPQISLTDGNHRLNYDSGAEELDWPPLNVPTAFCLTIGLTSEQEAALFKDINDNAKAMNTSHLAHLHTRLTETELLAAEDPALWIAQHLVDDPATPFHGIIYLGGERTQGLARKVNLAALRTSVEMIFRRALS